MDEETKYKPLHALVKFDLSDSHTDGRIIVEIPFIGTKEEAVDFAVSITGEFGIATTVRRSENEKIVVQLLLGRRHLAT